MKIKDKLFCILVTIIVLFVLLACVVVVQILQRETEQEKLSMLHSSLRQSHLSFEHVTDDVERYVFERCRIEEVASCILQQKNPSTRQLQIGIKLDSIIAGSLYLLDGYIVSLDGELYLSASTKNEQRFTELEAQGVFSSQRDVFWMRDDEGNLYLRRSIYQTYPYKVVAYAVFLVDQDYLRTLTGFDDFAGGDVCIINGYGDIVFTGSDVTVTPGLMPHLIGKIREGEVLERNYVYEGDEYRVFAVRGWTDSWHAIYAVPLRGMLSSFYHMRHIIIGIGGALILGALCVAYLVSYTFTANIRKLKRYIKGVKDDDLQIRIPDMGRDEIGDLASSFNGLLDRLEKVYHILLKESEDKQKTEYELLEFKYRSLQSQVSPHFICNILTSISLLAMTGNSGRVEQLAIDSSKYLRNNLSSNDKRQDTIREEIRLAKEYLRIVNAISAVSVELRVHCTEELQQALIPNMILQPLVENSIKHGIPPQSCVPFCIDIFVSETPEGALSLRIEDNGVGYSEEVIRELRALQADSGYQPGLIGFGTAGVIKRLALQYAGSFSFEVENAPDGGAVTTIVLPRQTEA